MPQSLEPKTRFRLASKERTNHWLDWCADPGNKAVLEAALAELVMKLKAGAATDAAACYYRIEGAAMFIQVLLNLAEETAPMMKATTPQLEPT